MTVALVTGGSRGIGRAISVELARSGVDVAINFAGNKDAAIETQKLCRAVSNKQIEIFQADVSNESGCQDLYKAVELKLGAPDILVNNAGITRDNLMMRMSVEEFDAVINTNLRSSFILSKLACRAMLKARSGRIINIASVVGLTGNIGQANAKKDMEGIMTK
jgi:3-oxoacyl-[acyl-carrier protein] reductase